MTERKVTFEPCIYNPRGTKEQLKQYRLDFYNQLKDIINQEDLPFTTDIANDLCRRLVHFFPFIKDELWRQDTELFRAVTILEQLKRFEQDKDNFDLNCICRVLLQYKKWRDITTLESPRKSTVIDPTYIVTGVDADKQCEEIYASLSDILNSVGGHELTADEARKVMDVLRPYKQYQYSIEWQANYVLTSLIMDWSDWPTDSRFFGSSSKRGVIAMALRRFKDKYQLTRQRSEVRSSEGQLLRQTSADTERLDKFKCVIM